MIHVEPIAIGPHTCVATVVELPKTTLIAISAPEGYIMCGALDVHLLNTRLSGRRIIAGRAVGVRSVKELLAAPLESVTDAAAAIGVTAGLSGREALRIMCERADGG